MIYEGEKNFLKHLDRKQLYSASIPFFREKKLPKEGIILFQGGGNFGDIWLWFHKFRNKIIAKRKNQKIIIFPQTVYYENEENLKRDAEIYNKHPNLTICVRDCQSYHLLKKYLYNNTILLLPDMAFFLDLKNLWQTKSTEKILLMKRTDKELLQQNLTKQSIDKFCKGNFNEKKIIVRDWQDYNESDPEKSLMRKKVRKNERMTKFLNKFSFGVYKIDSNFGINPIFHSKLNIKNGIELINGFDKIFTTRLHGAILGILLNKEVYILNNSYGKNGWFFDCWLKEFENCHMINKI